MSFARDTLLLLGFTIVWAVSAGIASVLLQTLLGVARGVTLGFFSVSLGILFTFVIVYLFEIAARRFIKSSSVTRQPKLSPSESTVPSEAVASTFQNLAEKDNSGTKVY